VEISVIQECLWLCWTGFVNI